ncbi:MAG: hypothetical protein RL748_3660 [Pseudomonadota bacterium]|jgi:uncharacterized protein (DUF1778 family)
MLTTEIPTLAGKTSRLEARVTEEQKSLLQRAAALAGQSLSEFIINSARDAAMRTISDFELIQLTTQERNAFVSTILNPPPPGERLKQAAANFKKKAGA